MDKLAIKGGNKVRTTLFPSQKTIGTEEAKAVQRVMESKVLSAFRGNFGSNFMGGHEVKELEREFSRKFNPNYNALAVNSCTSALYVACGAIGLKPGDEVIVTGYSMSCSATICMHYGAIPVFADIDDSFCLDPEDVKRKITKNTKAIIVVDLFGNIYDYKAINKIALDNHLYVIEDAAQAINSKRDGVYAGFAGHIGCFSFTQGKTLTCGEGGMIVTDSDELFIKCALGRNHLDAVINDMPVEGQNKFKDFNYPGMNLRMSEIQAVILREQLKKLDDIVLLRKNNVKKLSDKLCSVPGISLAKNNCDVNSYYVLPFIYDEDSIGIERDVFLEAVRAELTEEEGRLDKGVQINNGYISFLGSFPIFKGKHSIDDFPVLKRMQEKELFITLLHSLPLEDSDIEDIYLAFLKVYNGRFTLND
jgi:dTDP-4-amino-4,6-dideoxygalactose transaminase